jgi:drug/metabolite transporter (DMT)-like permease
MHKTTGRWRFGLALTLVAVFMWGALPIPLKMLFDVVDPYTITWMRCLASAVFLGLWLASRARLPALHQLSSRERGLLAIAVLGLASNHILYALGLVHITPNAAQVLIQLAPMFLLIGGLIFFHERFGAVQWLGFAALTAGLGLYFHDRLGELLRGGRYAVGVWLIVVASLLWACYAMAQKELLKALPSAAIMWCIYLAAAVLFLPAIHPSSLLRLDGVQIALLVFASLSTLVAYGCFAEALAHWEASRVSAVLVITPLVTMALVWWLARVSPGALPPEPLDLFSLGGALLVVIGSAMCALK